MLHGGPHQLRAVTKLACDKGGRIDVGQGVTVDASQVGQRPVVEEAREQGTPGAGATAALEGQRQVGTETAHATSCQKSEVRGQRSEVRDQKSEIRDQKSEIRNTFSSVF